VLYSLGAFLEHSVSDQVFFGFNTALLPKAKKLIILWLLSNKQTRQILGVVGDKTWKPQEIQLHIQKKSAWCPKGLLSTVTDLHSTLAFDSLAQFSPSHFYMLLKTWILKSLYNLDFFPSRKGVKQPADKCNFSSTKDSPLPTPLGFVLPILSTMSLFFFFSRQSSLANLKIELNVINWPPNNSMPI